MLARKNHAQRTAAIRVDVHAVFRINPPCFRNRRTTSFHCSRLLSATAGVFFTFCENMIHIRETFDMASLPHTLSLWNPSTLEYFDSNYGLW